MQKPEGGSWGYYLGAAASEAPAIGAAAAAASGADAGASGAGIAGAAGGATTTGAGVTTTGAASSFLEQAAKAATMTNDASKRDFFIEIPLEKRAEPEIIDRRNRSRNT